MKIAKAVSFSVAESALSKGVEEVKGGVVATWLILPVVYACLKD